MNHVRFPTIPGLGYGQPMLLRTRLRLLRNTKGLSGVAYQVVGFGGRRLPVAMSLGQKIMICMLHEQSAQTNRSSSKIPPSGSLVGQETVKAKLAYLGRKALTHSLARKNPHSIH